MLNKEVNKSIIRKWMKKSSNNVHEEIRASNRLKRVHSHVTPVQSCNFTSEMFFHVITNTNFYQF